VRQRGKAVVELDVHVVGGDGRRQAQ
jgi:hypothetical protein